MLPHEHLRKKGWSDKEISYLKKHFKPKEASILTYVFGTVLLLVAIFLIPYIYNTFSAFLPLTVSLTIFGVLGLVLGAVFGLLFISFNRFSHTKHTILVSIILAISIIVSPFLFSPSFALASITKQNALIPAAIYAITFSIPYVVLVKSEWNLNSGLSST